jgi:hypothetical protein
LLLRLSPASGSASSKIAYAAGNTAAKTRPLQRACASPSRICSAVGSRAEEGGRGSSEVAGAGGGRLREEPHRRGRICAASQEERGGAESPPLPIWSGRRRLLHLRRRSGMGEGAAGRPQSSRTSSSAAGRALTSSSTPPDLGSSARAGSWDLGSAARAESWELRPLHVLREGRPSTPTPLDDDELDAGAGAAFASYEIPPASAPRIHSFTSSVPDSGEHGRGSRPPCSSRIQTRCRRMGEGVGGGRVAAIVPTSPPLTSSPSNPCRSRTTAVGGSEGGSVGRLGCGKVRETPGLRNGGG